jgi:hypothetical protein
LGIEPQNSAPLGGISTVGGFIPGGYGGLGGQQNFYGYMDQLSNSAKRDAGKRTAPKSVLERWVTEQLKLLEGRQMSPLERFTLSYNLCDFEYDPTPYILALFFKGPQVLMLSIDQVFELMKLEPIVFFKLSMMEHVDLYVQQNSYENYVTFKQTGNSSFLSLEHRDGVPKNLNSFIGCLYRRAVKDGYRLGFEMRPTAIASFAGVGRTQILVVSLEKG